jgi:hypothetical protein
MSCENIEKASSVEFFETFGYHHWMVSPASSYLSCWSHFEHTEMTPKIGTTVRIFTYVGKS